MKTGFRPISIYNSDLGKYLRDWENSEYLPLQIDGNTEGYILYKYPIKIIRLPDNLVDHLFCYTAYAVRIDCYPLLWVLVKTKLEVDSFFCIVNPILMFAIGIMNKWKIMNTPLGSYASIKDLWFWEELTLNYFKAINSFYSLAIKLSCQWHSDNRIS